ncbi:hypothetical protein CFBP5507_07775 [Agrobacterium salinitolerans]|uniref:Uncharacterized protein n=1 Tax=Agrobacterium salinitolerans TaxID=1183413 RepID=A0A4Z1QYW4_9HYPH|nr:hypothetical protein [Agrobacterium salinitolerans]UYZ06162.1 hypothetical protein CFBP5507_07775 [Agrobacterium salinitolerans]
MLNRLATVVVAIGGAAAGVAATYAVASLVMVPAAKREGKSAAIAEIAIAAAKVEMQRKGDDASLQTKTDYELCVLGLRSNGLPVDACEQLRGVGQK